MSNEQEIQEKEIKDMWQETNCPTPGGFDALVNQLAAGVERFDRKVFWQNLVEYGAMLIVLARSGFDIADGERPLIAPLTSIAATFFIGFYLWRKYRPLPALDPSATATAYRAALLTRLEREIRMARSVRYWYVLPAWTFFVVVFAAGVARNRSQALFYGLEFLLASLFCAFIIWLNEHFRVRKLQADKDRVEAL
jgi:hypothetical protein